MSVRLFDQPLARLFEHSPGLSLTRTGTAHNASALISARCIQITIMKLVTYHSNYKYVGAVNMTDRDEPGMPLTVYRLDTSTPMAPFPKIEPISDQARQSMGVGHSRPYHTSQ